LVLLLLVLLAGLEHKCIPLAQPRQNVTVGFLPLAEIERNAKYEIRSS